MNYMDFTDDVCMNMFTTGQKIKMRYVFALNGARNSFLNSFACDSTLATGGPLPEDTLPVVKPMAGVRAYPNPVQNVLNLIPVNNFDLVGKSCIIYDVQGKIIIKQNLVSNKEKMDLSTLQTGIYILKIGNGADKKIIKIIKL